VINLQLIPEQAQHRSAKNVSGVKAMRNYSVVHQKWPAGGVARNGELESFEPPIKPKQEKITQKYMGQSNAGCAKTGSACFFTGCPIAHTCTLQDSAGRRQHAGAQRTKAQLFNFILRKLVGGVARNGELESFATQLIRSTFHVQVYITV
jgi:hypothetical protein